MKKLRFLLSLGLFLSLSACKKETIQTYEIPKEKPVSLPSMGGMSGLSMPIAQNDVSFSGLTWTAPAGWKAQTPSAMRVASFVVKASYGMDVDMSVVALAGGAGGELPNVNRWRDQVGLPALTSDQLAGQTTVVETSHFKFLVADMVSHDNLIDNHYKKRIVSAMTDVQGKTWFFKMTGEDQAVGSVKKAFLHFLETVKPS